MIQINNSVIILNYDKDVFNFRNIFENHFSKITKSELENIHEGLPKEYFVKNIVTALNDQNQMIYEFMYKIDSGYDLTKSNQMSKEGEFFNTYKRFVDYLASDIFKEDLIYQKRPTLRCHFVNNLAVGEFHRDRDYNHPIEEINVWLPITEARNNNTIQIEHSINSNTFRPVNLKYGQFIFFDSGLSHGNKINDTGKTRLSFDFRVIPKSMYKQNAVTKKSISQGIDLAIGDYYDTTKIF
jgi:hypothetical protein